ncbi:acetyltransferase [Microbacterium sp. KHB019]|uniref:acetyltransferase n=1 Tax=Microbacterium sp. KHB019 TaxID=3129770 RepID=UPI00307AD738
MTKEIIVIGAGGFGRETLDVIDAINAVASEAVWHVRGVVDDSPSAIQQTRLRARGVPWLGALGDNREALSRTSHIVAIGSPKVRGRLASYVDELGGRAATLVHPRAVIGSQVALGEGTVVCGGVQVSTNVKMGRHTHINPGAVVGHDASLDHFVSVNPGAVISGEVVVGPRSLIGAGAVILQGLEIGAEAVVGASACVTHNVPSGTTVYGVPARVGGPR